MRFSLQRIEPGTPALTELQALHVRCAQFVEETTGHPLRDDEAVRLLALLPPGMNLADKEVLGLHRDGEMVGVVELLRGYPGPTDWYIGLLLLAPEARGAGLGTWVLDEIVRRVVAEGGRALHLIVREDNPRALGFYQRHGFEVVDRRVQDLGIRKNLVFKMVRRL